MLKKLYDKSRLGFALFWIGAYCVLMSAADGASAAVGVEKSVTRPVGLLLCLVLFFFLSRNGLLESYGLCMLLLCSAILFYSLGRGVSAVTCRIVLVATGGM